MKLSACGVVKDCVWRSTLSFTKAQVDNSTSSLLHLSQALWQQCFLAAFNPLLTPFFGFKSDPLPHSAQWGGLQCKRGLNLSESVFFLFFLFNVFIFLFLSFSVKDETNCALCDSSGDLLDQLFCTTCGQHYHGMCLEVVVTPLKRAGWQCPDCKVCQNCK